MTSRNENKKMEKKRARQKKENQLNELMNVVQKYERTEKHLEKYSDISPENQIEHTLEVQTRRLHDIEDIKGKIEHNEI